MKSGPCLRHCYCSQSTLLLARVAIVYTLACVLYLLFTRRSSTPFLDSLTEDQLRIKRASVAYRSKVFLVSAALGAGVVAAWNPLRT